MDKIEITKADFKKACKECISQQLDMIQSPEKEKDKSIDILMALSKTMTLLLFRDLLIKKLFKDDDNAENV